MIVGIGTDLVYIPRISSLYQRWGNRFIHRIYCKNEIEYCLQHKDPSHTLAVRFAAKEACAKALGTGFMNNVSWRQMCICHEVSGNPTLMLRGAALLRAETIGAINWHITLTHEHEYAHALVILEN